jgi:putative component of toxin-antitoxin plasmid stabilization module
MKRLTAIFFRTESGEQPVRTWLLELDKANRLIVGQDIATVEFGWPVGMPVCRPLRDGVSEVRSTICKGKVEARVYFGVVAGRMVLLHAHQGKGRQDDAITVAIKRWRAFQRHGQEMENG